MPTPTATIFLPYSALDDVLLRGPRATQPPASAVTPGTLYSVSDEGNVIEQSTGTAWVRYGPVGATLSFSFDYSSATTAPPTSNQIRFNAGHPYTAVTTLWVRNVTTDGQDVHTYLLLLSAGSTVYVQDRNDHTLYARFTTTAAGVDHTTYVELPVAWVANGGALLNNQAVEMLVLTGGGSSPLEDVPPHHTTHEPGGTDALVALSASILTSGTVPDARLPANIVRGPATSGYLNVPRFNVTSGNSLDDSGIPFDRLARLDANNRFIGVANYFDNTLVVGYPSQWSLTVSQDVNVLRVSANAGAQALALDATGDVHVGRDLYVSAGLVRAPLGFSSGAGTVSGLLAVTGSLGELRLVEEAASANNRVVRLLSYQNAFQIWMADDAANPQAIASLDRAGNWRIPGSLFEQARTTALGAWTSATPSITCDSGTYSVSGVVCYSYMVVGKTLFLQAWINGSLALGTTGYLYLNIPGGYTAPGYQGMSSVPYLLNGTAPPDKTASLWCDGTQLVMRSVPGNYYAVGTCNFAFSVPIQIY